MLNDSDYVDDTLHAFGYRRDAHFSTGKQQQPEEGDDNVDDYERKNKNTSLKNEKFVFHVAHCSNWVL